MKTKIIVFLALMLAAMSPALAQTTPPPQISLSGSAEVKVAPDEIMLNVAVETRSATLEPARLENDQKIAAVLAFLKQSKIKDKDIQMDYINIQPDYNYDNSLSQSHVKPLAYIVRKNLEIRLVDVAGFQNILTGLLTNGVNYVNGIDFRTTQLRKYRDQARGMAIRAAKEKAQALTSELGAKLGKVTSINANDYSGYYGNYWGMNRGFNGFNNAIQNQTAATGGGASDAPEDTFAVGQISVSATVNVSFLIE
ncbi:MAG: SIMPL domain-containing protein [Verrucomicrobiae bacterium]|nr:SIMPL domain-containing protein [Verrucomicrobiae bacterium]